MKTYLPDSNAVSPCSAICAAANKEAVRNTAGSNVVRLLAFALISWAVSYALPALGQSDAEKGKDAIGKCPVMGDQAGPYRHTAAGAMTNRDWWPHQLNLDILHQNSAKVNPMGETSTTPKNSRSSISLA